MFIVFQSDVAERLVVGLNRVGGDDGGHEDQGGHIAANGPTEMGGMAYVAESFFHAVNGIQKVGDPQNIGRQGDWDEHEGQAHVWLQQNSGIEDPRHGSTGPNGTVVGLLPVEGKRQQAAGQQAHQVDGLQRIRFLTSHPNWFTTDLMDSVAALPRVMPHIEVPHQAGHDLVLKNMKREYTVQEYKKLVADIRERIPGVSIATDVIVGFPGETKEHFQSSYELLEELRLDVVHLARYSPRPGTVAARRMDDDVPEQEKWRRFRLIEELQEGIADEINQAYLGTSVEVLFEGKNKNRWRGRTPTNKLVFVESEQDLLGKEVPVRITWAGPWSMQAGLLES